MHADPSDAGAHPLLGVLLDAAGGRFPPVDGDVEWMAPDLDGTHAVVELTGHSYVLSSRSRADAPQPLHGYGGCTHPDVLRWLAGPDGWVGSLDAVLVRRAEPGTALPVRADVDDHPRVLRSREHRRDVVVLGDDRGLVTIGTGLAGRTELSVELTGERRPGDGRALIAGGLAAIHARRGPTWVFAQVAPGNAASLRAFLAAGFVPIGSEVLLGPVA